MTPNSCRRGAAFAVAICAVVATPAMALSIDEFVVFGDSNVDIGRLGDPVPNDGAVPPPNTVGPRAADGPIIPEFLASRVGVPQTNHAFGGAESGAENIVGLFGNADFLPTGTLSQIDEFEAAVGATPVNPNALFLIWAGSNDLVFIEKSSEAENVAAVDGAVTNLTEAVTRLDAVGARTIVLATRTTRPVLSSSAEPWALPDLDPLADGVQNPELNDSSGNFLNAAIRRLVPDLDAIVPADVLLFDADAVIRDIIAGIAGSGANGFFPTTTAKPHIASTMPIAAT